MRRVSRTDTTHISTAVLVMRLGKERQHGSLFVAGRVEHTRADPARPRQTEGFRRGGARGKGIYFPVDLPGVCSQGSGGPDNVVLGSSESILPYPCGLFS